MFFVLSKVFWFFAMPLNLIWSGLTGSIILLKFKENWGKRLLIFFLGLFVFLGIAPVGYNMMVFLERTYERPDPMPDHVDGIIVLGGAFNSKMYEETGMIAATGNINRIIDFIDLANQYPKAKLVFSGGSGHLMQTERKEADDVEKFMDIMGIDERRLLFERQSRNSYENILFSKKLVKPQDGETWIIITSGFHLPRVMGIFQKLEWRVIPYPSSPQTGRDYRFWPKSFNILSSYHYLGLALKEFVGSTVYSLTGKRDFLLR